MSEPNKPEYFPICPKCGSTTSLSDQDNQLIRKCTNCTWFETMGESKLVTMKHGTMFSTDGRYVPLSQRGVFQTQQPLKIAESNYNQLAQHMVSDFNRRVQSEYVDYFGRMGFNAESVLDPEILFEFMSVISYDMRPLDYKQVWGPPNHPEYDRNSVKQALEDLDLDHVKMVNVTDLTDLLRGKKLKIRNNPALIFTMDAHDWGEAGRVDHSRGLKELAAITEDVAGSLGKLHETRDVPRLYEMIDSVHGFGVALTSKTILFTVRCFGIGFARVDPQNLRRVAEGILRELVVRRRVDALVARGIDIRKLLDELLVLRDPLAIEVLYLLDEPGEFEALLNSVK